MLTELRNMTPIRTRLFKRYDPHARFHSQLIVVIGVPALPLDIHGIHGLAYVDLVKASRRMSIVASDVANRRVAPRFEIKLAAELAAGSALVPVTIHDQR